MYHARIDTLRQEFVIEFEGGNFIACRAMPYQQSGRKALMANEANQEAWRRIRQLVVDANQGRRNK